MFNNNLPVSSLFCKISLLCFLHYLPTCILFTFFFFSLLCFLHHPHSMHLLSIVPIRCSTPLTSSHMHYTQQHQQPHHFSVSCTYSFCAPCACNVRNASACSHCVHLLHISSALSNHHGNPSASLAVCPHVQHHWMS